MSRYAVLQSPTLCEWVLTRDSQIAIAKFFDGETADPVAEALASSSSVPPPRPSAHRETLINGSMSHQPTWTDTPDFHPAPRIVPQPESQVTSRPSFILTLLFAPFSILSRLAATSFGLFSRIFPFLPRLYTFLFLHGPTRGGSIGTRHGRRPLNPRDTAARFIREFEEEYGSNELPFLECGYAQALDRAQKNLEFLLVILFSPEHDDTSPFVQETLLSPEVINFIKSPQNNIILWAGSVQDSEAYQVSTALNCTKFPFAALIAHTPRAGSTAMSAVTRLAGPMPSTTFVAKLQNSIAQCSEPLERVREARATRQADRDLRASQAAAFERSLAQDQERSRLKREAEAAKERAEREAREKAETEAKRERDLRQWREWRAGLLRPEPGPDVKDATRVSFKMMPSGDRVVRRFAPDAVIEELYAFVECYGVLDSGSTSVNSTVNKPEKFEHVYGFRLIDPLPPRKVIDLEAGGTVRDRIGRSANLFVDLIEEDVDEEE
jgi:FAS-associated factor 2